MSIKPDIPVNERSVIGNVCINDIMISFFRTGGTGSFLSGILYLINSCN